MKRFWFACCALSGCLFLGLPLAVQAQEKPKGTTAKTTEKQPAAKKKSE